ncbi:MAG: serine hydrolase [Chitinophagaceae bacterium]
MKKSTLAIIVGLTILSISVTAKNGLNEPTSKRLINEIGNSVNQPPFGNKTRIQESDLAEVTEVLMDYIEGTANGQPERLKRAFHSDFNLYYVDRDTLRVWKGSDYIGNIKLGERNDRKGRIVSINIVNNAASATVEIDIPSRKRIYTDYMLLLKYQGGWKIIHKSFTFQPYADLSGEAQEIDKIISSYHKYDLFNGNVFIAQKGKEILKKSYGKANFSWSIDNSTKTKFRVGSLTKQFTALLILQLKQEGKLSLDDKIIKHLPWYFPATGSKLTIHHLLSMTSGLPNYTDEANPTMEREDLSPKEFALKYFKDTLLFVPGKNISYSNTGYYILGLIIEAITKKSYESVLCDKVLRVLGMDNSGVESPNQSIPHLAEGYTFYMGEYVIPHSINTKTMTFSAGAIYSTVEDLFLWDQSFYTDKLLNAENRRLMCSIYLPNYGYGVAVNKKKNYLGTNTDITLISHDGGIGGFSSYMARIPEDSIFIVLLDNTRAGMRGKDLVGIANNILPILYNLKAEPPKPMAYIELLLLIKSTTIDQGISHFRTNVVQNKTVYDFTGLENSLNLIGYHYISVGEFSSAVKILKLNTEQFPNSANAHDSLGEAYYRTGQWELALREYVKSYELDPGNENAKKMIDQISKIKLSPVLQ